MKINCEICGIEVEAKRNSMRFCKKCGIINQRKLRREHYQKHKTIEDQQTKIWRDKNKAKVKENWEKWYQKNKKRIKEKRQREDIKNGRKINAKKYRKKYPEKTKAQSLARNNIKIPKGQMCQDCGTNLAIERHHEDYSKPLGVVFLCKECHTKRTLGG